MRSGVGHPDSLRVAEPLVLALRHFATVVTLLRGCSHSSAMLAHKIAKHPRLDVEDKNMDFGSVQSLCTKYDIRPSKKFGQNFVVDEEVIEKVVKAANLKPDDYVVEVGPGLGILTVALVEKVRKVLAVELDKKVYSAAKEILAPYANVELMQSDVLKLSNQKIIQVLGSQTYKVVANLPYSITSAALRKFTEYEPRPDLCVFMVQREVAQRVCAKPGDMSMLSFAVQYYGNPEIVDFVPRSSFWPEPEVDSAILKIEVLGRRSRVVGIDEKRLFQIVRIGFSSRRKQLQNNLSAGLRLSRQQIIDALREVSLEAKVRPQELSVGNWIALSRII